MDGTVNLFVIRLICWDPLKALELEVCFSQKIGNKQFRN